MENKSPKPWEKPWTTQQIVDNASKWSLAGDVAVLKTLEAFSERLFERANKTNDNLKLLVDNLTNAGLRLDIAKNEFLNLQNRQFVESRVYEDDETVSPEENKEKEDEKEPSEDDVNKEVERAILKGLEVMDQYYDKVEVSISDSEDESDIPNFVLRPKDPYIDRPLPYLIGTDEWYKKWHVGLIESSSESDSDKISEKFSDSDSEADLPISNRAKMSNTSSESDLKRPAANSTFNDTVKDAGIVISSSSEEGGSAPAKAPISSSSFAEQLAAKLGNMAEHEEVVNRNPIQKSNTDRDRFVGLFADEPPPLDDGEDDLYNKGSKEGMFSGGGGLFDDDDDDFLVKTESSIKGLQVDKPKEEEKADIVKEPVDTKSVLLPKTTGGLFDDEDDIDDLFSGVSSRKTETKTTLLPSKKAPVPFYEEEPPELEEEVKVEDKRKKPIGGVSIFGGSDLFANQKIGNILKRQQTDSSTNSDDESPPKSDQSIRDFKGDTEKPKENQQSKNTTDLFQPKPVENKPKTVSLFDDNDDLFEDDLFSNITTKKFTSNLFSDSPPSTDLFGKDTTDFRVETDKNSINSHEIDIAAPEEKPVIKEQETKKVMENKQRNSLFDEEDDGGIFEDVKKVNTGLFSKEDDLFAAAKAEQNTSATSDVIKPPISNVSVKVESKPVTYEDDIFVTPPKEQIPSPPVVAENNPETTLPPKQSPKLSLFDDFSNDDDLFSDIKPFKSIGPRPEAEGEEKIPKVSKVSLFDSTPPSDDDGEDDFGSSKPVENIFESIPDLDEQGSTNVEDKPKRTVSIFDPTPPPDDDWETKSEEDIFAEAGRSNSVVTQDVTSSVINSTTERSSNFLHPAPPLDSLVSNESGIVRDASIGCDSDVSAFYPESSSTRRLSIDLFNDDYSSDNLFITKNKTEVVPSLQDIPEVTVSSNLDVTPSGNPEDLFSDGALNSSVFESTKVESEVEKKGDGVISGDGECVSEVKVKVETKPPVAKRIMSGGDKDQEGLSTIKKASPGKLKLNLNINVGALMPGATPPKRELIKSQSLEISTAEKDSEIISAASESDVRGENIADGIGNVEVLRSITKDRAKIPIKRRPSTRRARQELIRKSVGDFSLNSSEASPPEESKKPAEDIKADMSLPPATNIVEAVISSKVKDVTTDEEIQDIIAKVGGGYLKTKLKDEPVDLFKDDPSQENSTLFKAEISEGPTSKSTKPTEPPASDKKSLFDSQDSDSEDDLFKPKVKANATIKLPAKTNVVTANLFDDDDGLFGSRKPTAKAPADYKPDLFEDAEEDIFSAVKLPPKSNLIKKSLFDDDPDEDDIFGEGTSTGQSKESGFTKASPSVAASKPSVVRKLDTTQLLDDPLDALKK